MDPILYWNKVALEANRISHTNGKNEQTGPPLSARALAMVHLAMYDAFAGASGNPANLPPYLPDLPAPAVGASADAAVAAAVHATLSNLFPSQKTFFDLKHVLAGLTGTGLNEGHRFGLMVAQKMLDDRKDDPPAGDDGYAASMARGAHRVDPDNPGQGYHAPLYGAKCKCFAVTARHGLDAPPRLNTQEYMRALREVRGKGIAPELMGTVPSNSRRTVDETLIAIYWTYDGAVNIGTPPRLYNQIIRKLAVARGNSPAANARLFALVNAAMGDAGILAWDQKYIHDLWRPVVGIREHDISMGPGGTAKHNIDNDCHSIWLPLGAPSTNSTAKNFTPPFPAYPSGHATFGAAAFQIARLFYGVPIRDRNPDALFQNLEFVSDELDGINKDNKGTIRPRHVRSFPDGLWQMIEENGRSRVYLGVHWVFDAFAVDSMGNPDFAQNIGGVPLGIKIAEDIFSDGMKKSSVGPQAGGFSKQKGMNNSVQSGGHGKAKPDAKTAGVITLPNARKTTARKTNVMRFSVSQGETEIPTQTIEHDKPFNINIAIDNAELKPEQNGVRNFTASVQARPIEGGSRFLVGEYSGTLPPERTFIVQAQTRSLSPGFYYLTARLTVNREKGVLPLTVVQENYPINVY